MIVIEARRWLDRLNGNTYHSVTLYENGEVIGRADYEPGGGNQYLHTACQIMQKTGRWPQTNERVGSFPKDLSDFLLAVRDHKRFLPLVSNVGRKGDL